MTGNEVKAMKDDVLASELASLRDKLYRIRTQTATEKVEDVSQFGKVRRDIARILTVLATRRGADQAKA